MLLQLDEWHLGYKQIIYDVRNNPNGNQGRVLILSSTDTDAICACRILTYLLRADDICYELRPCISYPTFISTISKLENDIVGIVCINIGAMRNLSKLQCNVKLYIFDSHRPFHLGNIHAGENVVVFLEGWRDDDDVISDGDDLSGRGGESSSDDDSDSSDSDDDSFGSSDGDEQEFEGGDDHVSEEQDNGPKRSITPSPNSKRKRNRLDIEDDDTAVSSLQDDDDDDNSKNIQPTEGLSLKELRRTRRRRIAVYYSSGTYHSVPASWAVFMLSQQLRFSDSSDLLWLACVGLSDAYLHHRLSVTGYNHLASFLSSDVKRLFPQDLLSKSLKALYAKDNTPISTSEHGAILCELDFIFFLLRHSSLYDSMTHTTSLALHFKVWKRDGVEVFRELLAKMGFPLQECRQPYYFMKPTLRKRLKDALVKCSEEYGLNNRDLFYQGFFRITGYQSFLSAADMAYAISALQELPSSSSKTQDVDDQDQDERRTLQCFHQAYDALSNTNSTSLQSGLRLAKQLQKTIISAAISLDEKNAIVRLLHFRYAYLHHCSSSEDDAVSSTLSMFSNPLALTRLAHFIVLMKLQQVKQKGNLPLVLLTEKPNQDKYLVIGYTWNPEDEVVKNKFESLFELAAESMGEGQVKFESFEGNCVEVDKRNVQKFMEQLHYFMDAE